MPIPLVSPRKGGEVEAMPRALSRPGTVVDVLHGRVLSQHLDGLFQYVALRLGSLEGAKNAISELRAIATATDADDLVRSPGIRPRLYRIARRVALRKRVGGAPPSERALLSLPFLQGGPALDAIRRLDPEAAELLELRHARRLSPDDIAFVVERAVDDVLLALDEATRVGQSCLDAAPGAEGLALHDALERAFALDPAARQTVDPLPAPDEGLRPGSILGGRYAIEARVGTGAFGDVYRANDTEVPGHVVGLKLLHRPALNDHARAIALRELHLIAAVFHPSIVQFKDYGWFDDRLWFVMPWYEGETLEARIARQKLGRSEARRIFEPLARALAVMHAAGIRHQDIKPDNIFLAKIAGFGGADGEEAILPVLLDLGVAAKDAEMLIAGTPTYFAPEVAAQFASIEPRPRVTPQADVFALALTLRNALEPDTHDVVPTGGSDAFVAARATTPPSLPRSRDLRFLRPHLARWMSLDPNARPSADELANELAILTEPEEKRKRRNALLRWLVPLVSIASVVLAVVFVLLSARAERERTEALRARAAAAGLREDLDLTRGKARALEANLKEIERGYERSALSRRELATELSTQRARSEFLDQEIARLRRLLVGSQGQLETATARIDQLEASLRVERERAFRAERETQREMAELRREKGELEIAAATSRARLSAEVAKSENLLREIAQVHAAKVRAESALAALRAARRSASPEDGEESETSGPEIAPGGIEPPLD